MTPLVRIFLLLGILFLVIGGLIYLAGRFNINIPFGRLPGDIRIERDGFVLYFPLVSCILGSILLTIILNLIGRFWKS